MATRHNVSLSMIAVALLSAGCASAPAREQASTEEAGAQIWRTLCSRCHNHRAAEEFDPEHWEVAVSHMRTIAVLSKSEAESVIAFLRDSAQRRAGDRAPTPDAVMEEATVTNGAAPRPR